MKPQAPSNKHPEIEPAGDRIQAIQEYAYRLYKRRGGEPGHELDDWLEAERIVCRQRDRKQNRVNNE